MVEEMGHAEARIVLLANCWLDRPEVLDRLATVFAGFQGCPQVRLCVKCPSSPCLLAFIGCTPWPHPATTARLTTRS